MKINKHYEALELLLMLEMMKNEATTDDANKPAMELIPTLIQT